MIVPHLQIRTAVDQLYEAGGLPKGDKTGWPSVDEFYTVGMGTWTLVTGVPHSGKSEWLDALLVNLASRGPWQFLTYSPENWPLALHHSKILEKRVGKPFSPGPTERMSAKEVAEGEEWMRGRFNFAKPEKPSIFSILEEAVGFMGRGLPERKVGIVIDPWNMLDHNRPANMTETEYVSQTLSECIRVVREMNWHLWLVAHPAKLFRDKNGSYPIPRPSDVSGSAAWWAKADNCICVHRDQAAGSQEVDIHVQKVRFKHMGRVGVTTLRYDRVTGRYGEMLRQVWNSGPVPL